MKIKLKYFAAMREACGKSEEILDTAAQTAQELFTEVGLLYPINLDANSLKVAVNEEYVDFSSRLNENDTVVFIPPVAGG